MLEHDNAQSPAALDDEALTQKVVSLLGHERASLVAFLLHLAELDARRLFVAQGYSSLYAYCRDHLRLSEGGSYRRYTAARLMARFPVIAQYLRDGRLSLVRLASLREVLTEENHRDLLEQATLGTERDVEVLAASLKPKPDISDGVRRLPVKATTGMIAPCAPSPASTPSPALASSPSAPVAAEASRAEVQVASAPLFEVAPRMEVEATSATAFALRMRVGPECLAEFEAVKAALSHKIPDGNFEAVLRECFRITLEAVQRRRQGSTRKCGRSANPSRSDDAATDSAPTAPPAESDQPSRYIPAAVRRAVWKRDGWRCAFVSEGGRRCDATHKLEVHHITPHARGGPATVENLSLRCRSHNLYEAELAFGADFMRSPPFWRCEDSRVASLQDPAGAAPTPSGPH